MAKTPGNTANTNGTNERPLKQGKEKAIVALEERVLAIEERNRKVASDKAWETSKTRRFLIAAFTYIAIGTYLWATNVPSPWLSAIIPTAGFLLSTFTFPFFRRVWEKYRA